ncbi:MAG: argininosuccinate lyase [Chloroflexi bacterium]|nr:argininosuccinate lyase [Chloroflexota bacterium]
MAFTSSLGRDARFWREELAVAVAHVEMLGRCGIVDPAESESVVAGLRGIAADFAANGVPVDGGDEDIHALVERLLGEAVGPSAGHLRTARSRNDQVATAFKLYVQRATTDIWAASLDLFEALVGRAGEQGDTIAPGMTHLQVGQPILLAHHLLAHAEALRRVCRRCAFGLDSASELPLGAGAMAGTSFPIDPEYVARRLGFRRTCNNSVDAVANRDFVVEFLQLCSLAAVNLSRLAEEIVIWASQPFAAVVLPDAWATGSSIMPQKKNPDVAELVRGRAGTAIGRLAGFQATLKSLPLAYNLDLQEDKQAVYGAEDDTLAGLLAMTGLVANLHFRSDRLAEIAAMGASAATDLADYLVGKGVPFDRAHSAVGALVAELERQGRDLASVDLKTLRSIDQNFDERALERLDPGWAVRARTSPGGTAPVQVRAQVESAQSWAGSERQRVQAALPNLPLD